MLYAVFDWFELTPLGVAIRDSIWLFPVIESGHLLALSVLGGAVLVVDLRLLGLGLTEKSIDYVRIQARPFFLGALLAMIATGIPLFLSEAVKCYFSDAFWVKMVALGLALGFTFGVKNRLIAGSARLLRWQRCAMAGSSMALWLTVAAAGRWIGFS